MNWLLVLGILIVLLASVVNSISVMGAEIQLTQGTKVALADQHDSAAELRKVDSFIKRLSPFDRAARMKTDKPVSQDEFLRFISAQAQPWTPDEVQKLTSINHSVAAKLNPLHLPFPPLIKFIKTSGLEEGRAAYCRGNCVVLPVNEVHADNHKLENLVIHELFHILSRNNPQLRESLYQVIGFKPCDEIACPHVLEERKITNPDAPIIENYIIVTDNGNPTPVVPILYSSEPQYNLWKGGEFFNYLAFKLMIIKKTGEHWEPALNGSNPQLLDPSHVAGFREQIGANTEYTIHPEEVLADNFVLLVNHEKSAATPKIISEMNRILGSFGNNPQRDR